MIIDIHGHLGNINQAPFWAADAKQLEQYCQKAGVDLLCISSANQSCMMQWKGTGISMLP